jgi:hypothetical protein
MLVLCTALLLAGVWPLWRAWLRNRRTSLVQAVNWAIVAWAAWALAFVAGARGPSVPASLGYYLALCLTGCAGVAVLGARRPGVTAWNFVVAGLLAVNGLPLAQSVLLGRDLELDSLRAVAVAATIAVGILNYLPTRFALASLLLLVGCGLVFRALLQTSSDQSRFQFGGLALALTPWSAFLAARRRPSAPAEFDRLWLAFRDRFGFVWGQRLRDQFNRSARHAGWQVILRWQGLRILPGADLPDPAAQEAMLSALWALQKRFGPDGEKEESFQ